MPTVDDRNDPLGPMCPSNRPPEEQAAIAQAQFNAQTLQRQIAATEEAPPTDRGNPTDAAFFDRARERAEEGRAFVHSLKEQAHIHDHLPGRPNLNLRAYLPADGNPEVRSFDMDDPAIQVIAESFSERRIASRIPKGVDVTKPTVITSYEDGVIVQTVTKPPWVPDQNTVVCMANLQDEAVRRVLVREGWTPPASPVATTDEPIVEWTEERLAMRRVVCAAIRLTDGTIVTSARHFDTRMREFLKVLCGENRMWSSADANQGFIDQWGNWLSREEAWVIAERQGQIARDIQTPPGRLYSEHLY